MESKIRSAHLDRRAYVYIRQSTARQVFENTESTTRQYALAEQAQKLGWAPGSIEVIDEDLGHSGSTKEGRPGFVRLSEAVAHGDAGAIFALEVSRLARSSQDWQQLLALCGVAQVLVVDEQTIYDPEDANDKLLLDLKGTMSEAELHWLRLRLTGARRSKARRGALRIQAPTGYVWGDDGFEKDPDEAVRQAIQTVFDRFAIEPTAWAVVRWARESGFRVPVRSSFSDGTTELSWKPLGLSRLCVMLHNPTYAGTYAYGRQRIKKALLNGKIHSFRATLEPDEWAVRIHGAHAGYIDWETFMGNQRKLRDNLPGVARGGPGAPREGRALLTGLLICGRCGRRMFPMYWGDDQGRFSYACRGERDRGQVMCWSVTGVPVDEAVEELFLETMVPSELELCLAIDQEVKNQTRSLEQQWKLRLERAEYEARRAERRYMAVDPENRVVARTLENDWELRLRELEKVKRDLEVAKQEQCLELDEEEQQRIRALARDLGKVWRARTTTPADRQAMLRLVIEAVAIEPIEVPNRQTRIRVQWQSGAITELAVARPGRHEWSRTSAKAVSRITELAAAGRRDEEIAEQLNEENIPTGAGKQWDTVAVKWARRRNEIPRTAPDLPRRQPLPDRHPDGRYSIGGAARRFDVGDHVVRGWVERGMVKATREDFQAHTRVYWLEIDAKTAARLEEAARRTRSRMKPRR
jgi:DNA invertase Pin-like site-specific DNA recombinase